MKDHSIDRLCEKLHELADEIDNKFHDNDPSYASGRLRELAGLDMRPAAVAKREKEISDQGLSDLLLLVGVTVPHYSVRVWTADARKQVEQWASLTHLSASDNDVEVPPRPPFLHNHGEVNCYHCHFCGTYVYKGYEGNGTRHWLSDCRPDLVQHEPGPTCTWYEMETTVHGQPSGRPYDCYAYQDRSGPTPWTWTDEHKHFDKDGPM